MSPSMLYLSSAYGMMWPGSRDVQTQLARQRQYEGACRAFAALMNGGHRVFSPVVCRGGIDLPETRCSVEFWAWRGMFESVMRACDELVVLVTGDSDWLTDRQVRLDIELAKSLALPIRYVNVEGVFVDAPEAQ